MGLGQTMLSVIAMAMLATVLLTANTNLGDNATAIQMSQYRIMAASLGTSTIERATGLAFDSASVSSDVNSYSQLAGANFPRESGKSATNDSAYTDFEDYNHFSKWVMGDSVFFRSANFYEWAWVDYVTVSGDSISHSSTPTWNKRIMVFVTSPFMNDTLHFSTVYSYWYFR